MLAWCFFVGENSKSNKWKVNSQKINNGNKPLQMFTFTLTYIYKIRLILT
jgi:hypothetical protein